VDLADHELRRDHIAAPEQRRQNQQQIGLIEQAGINAAISDFERLCHRRLGDVRTSGLSSYSAVFKRQPKAAGRTDVLSKSGSSGPEASGWPRHAERLRRTR